MQKRKLPLILFLVIILFTLSWCFKIDINHTISEDWKSKLKVMVDVTQMRMMMEAEWKSWVNMGSENTICKDTESNKYIKNQTCSIIDKDHSIISWDVDLNQYGWFLSKNNLYVYDVSKINIINNGSESEDWGSMNFDMWWMSWMSYMYYLKMPWEIVRTEIWNISWNTLIVDLLKNSNLKTSMYVVSKTPGTNPSDADINSIINDLKSIQKSIWIFKILNVQQQERVNLVLSKLSNYDLNKFLRSLNSIIINMRSKSYKTTSDETKLLILEDIKTLVSIKLNK